MKLFGLGKQAVLATSISLILFSSTLQAQDVEGEGASATPAVEDASAAALQYIEANRASVEAAILSAFSGQSDDNGEQLAIALSNASAAQLQAAQNATSPESLNLALGGDPFENSDGMQNRLARVGDLDKDYTFTPVAPCRVADTRETGGGGQLIPNEIRDYYVYGSATTLATQGGNVACASPVGEPRGVMISLTIIPVVGAGTINAYPANEAAPDLGTIVVYQKSAQGAISSTSSVKTFNSTVAANKEIRIINKFGQANVVIDVVGYFSAPDTPAGVEYTTERGTGTLTSTAQSIHSIAVTMPSAGHCVINASGYFRIDSATGKGQCDLTNGATTLGINDQIIANGANGSRFPFALTRGFAQSAGTTTYRVVCDEDEPEVTVWNVHMTANCSANKH